MTPFLLFSHKTVKSSEVTGQEACFHLRVAGGHKRHNEAMHPPAGPEKKRKRKRTVDGQEEGPVYHQEE